MKRKTRCPVCCVATRAGTLRANSPPVPPALSRPSRPRPRLVSAVHAALTGASTSGKYLRVTPMTSGGTGYAAAHLGNTVAGDHTSTPSRVSMSSSTERVYLPAGATPTVWWKDVMGRQGGRLDGMGRV